MFQANYVHKAEYAIFKNIYKSSFLYLNLSQYYVKPEKRLGNFEL